MARRERGSALLAAIAFAVVITTLVVGLSTLSLSHYKRVEMEHSYASAMDMTEAGINWELNQMSLSINNADVNQRTVTTPMGQASTSFAVQCVDRNTNNPWSGIGTPLDMVCTGVVKNVQRRVRIGAKSYSMGPADYALFAIVYGEIKGTSDTVTGDVGTDGSLNFAGSPTITGSVVFNGQGSDWASAPPSGYTVYHNPYPVLWETVTSIANRAFPNGGLNWLATHNDNALCNKIDGQNRIILKNSQVATLVGKPGGANYYLTTIDCGGQSSISFDNTNGGMTLWCSGNGTWNMAGGTSMIKNSVDPTKAIRIYVSSTQDFSMHGNSRVDAGLYHYDGPSSGAFNVVSGGTPDIYGQVITNNFKLNGSATIHYDGGYFSPIILYWGFDGSWKEETPL